MLRLFRSIRQNLLQQGKVSRYIGYAIGEIILIMVGIFLAFQLNNWNEARKMRAQEQVILAEIHEEFLNNKSEFESTVSMHKVLLEKLDLLIESFPLDIETVDFAALAHTLEGSIRKGDYDETTTTISKLKNSSFDIISNEELRNLLLTWEFLALDYGQREELHLKFLIEQFEPAFLDLYGGPSGEGFKDPRANLAFFETMRFEGLIRTKRWYIERLTRMADFENDRNIIHIMDRILELSKPDE